MAGGKRSDRAELKLALAPGTGAGGGLSLRSFGGSFWCLRVEKRLHPLFTAQTEAIAGICSHHQQLASVVGRVFRHKYGPGLASALALAGIVASTLNWRTTETCSRILSHLSRRNFRCSCLPAVSVDE